MKVDMMVMWTGGDLRSGYFSDLGLGSSGRGIMQSSC